MKSVVRVRLRVTPAQADALARTLRRCNEAANLASAAAHGDRYVTAQGLQRAVYAQVKDLGLSAQPALHAIRKTAHAYKAFYANLNNGNYGAHGSKRYKKATAKPVSFRPDGAQPFDDRCLSWQMDKQTVSIWTVDGRLQGIPFAGNDEQVTVLKAHRKGESDLIEHQGKFYLAATIDVPEPELRPVSEFLGVDMGIVNIATTSDGVRISGKTLNRVRHKNRRLRRKLQAKNTKSATRRLKHLSGREARFSTNTNHVISKRIVAEAQRTGKGVAMEDLAGIRSRVRLRKPQRATLHSWAFGQLGEFLTYKALAAGVPLVRVNPAYTSQDCSACGHRDKKNRRNQADFTCLNTECGVSLHADVNAAINIAKRGIQ